MIIDFHNHLSVQSSPYRLPAEAYLAAMDENGVEKTVLLGRDYGRLGAAGEGNLSDEDVAGMVRQHPDRFIGFTAAHPDWGADANVQRVERAVCDLGMKGIKLNPALGFYPNDRSLYPVYETASGLGIPVVFHAGLKPPAAGSRMKYCHPMYLDDVAVDFPALRIVIAHAGYPWVEETVLVGLYADNVFADISTLNQIEDVLGQSVLQPTLQRLQRAWGAGRIVFGSDGIFNLEALITAVMQADFLSDRDREHIFYSNACALLNLEQNSGTGKDGSGG